MDLDQDGLLDVIAGSGALLQGDGTGAFRTAATLDLPLLSLGMLTADFNEDGRLDLAVLSAADDRLSVLLTAGSGYAPAIYLNVGQRVTGIAAPDLNADGHKDLVVLTSASAILQSRDSLSVFLGDGRGGFTPVPAPSFGRRPAALALADWNQDGKLDLAIANSAANDVYILRGDGTGRFAAPLGIAVDMGPSVLIAADFNHDRRPDLAVLNQGNNSLLILVGDGTGSLFPQGRHAAPASTVAALSGYIDADSHLDILVAGKNESLVLLGDGAGGFRTGPPVDIGEPINGAALGDLNGDRFADLVATTTSHDACVRILMGLGGGRFAPARRYTVLSTPASPVLSDFNQDGLLDILVNSSDVAGVTVLDNRSL
jgi:hypothetical protein